MRPDDAGPSLSPARRHAAFRTMLDRLYRRYNRPCYIATDPLAVVYDCADPADREIAGLIAAGLAFGDADQIQRAARHALSFLGPRPKAALMALSPRDIRRLTAGFRYRWVSGEHLATFLLGLRWCLQEFGSVEGMVAAAKPRQKGREDPAGFLWNTLVGWTRLLWRAMGVEKHPMWPDPARGGACKRTLLYLRWMIRQDAVDPGGWTVLTPGMLLCPVDRHIHRFARSRGITKRSAADWKTTVEITRFFRGLCPRDPCRWDFALTRAAMLNLFPTEWTAPQDKSDQSTR